MSYFDTANAVLQIHFLHLVCSWAGMCVVIGHNITPQPPKPIGQTAEIPIFINLPPVDLNYEREKIQNSFPKRVMLLLSILQIVCGCLVFLLQIWAKNYLRNYQYVFLKIFFFPIMPYFFGEPHCIFELYFNAGWGIWIAASGVVGLIGALKPSKCM